MVFTLVRLLLLHLLSDAARLFGRFLCRLLPTDGLYALCRALQLQLQALPSVWFAWLRVLPHQCSTLAVGAQCLQAWLYMCMGALMVTFSKTQNNVTTAAFAAWSLQCHYGVTTMSLQRHYKAAETASSTKVGIPTLLKSFARFQSQTAFSQLK